MIVKCKLSVANFFIIGLLISLVSVLGIIQFKHYAGHLQLTQRIERGAVSMPEQFYELGCNKCHGGER